MRNYLGKLHFAKETVVTTERTLTVAEDIGQSVGESSGQQREVGFD